MRKEEARRKKEEEKRRKIEAGEQEDLFSGLKGWVEDTFKKAEKGMENWFNPGDEQMVKPKKEQPVEPEK